MLSLPLWMSMVFQWMTYYRMKMFREKQKVKVELY